MMSISRWAKAHIIIARFLIVVSKLALVVLAAYIGVAFYQLKITPPAQQIYFYSVLAFLITIAVYPGSKLAWHCMKRKRIVKRVCNFILPLLSSLVMITWFNNADIVNDHSAVYGSNYSKVPTAIEILNSGKTKSQLTKQEKRILKREFSRQLKVYAAATVSGDKAKAATAWKISLAIIGMVGLLYLVAILSCNLSCSGYDGAAVAVALIGFTGIIWGFIAVLKAIQKSKKKQQAKVE